MTTSKQEYYDRLEQRIIERRKLIKLIPRIGDIHKNLDNIDNFLKDVRPPRFIMIGQRGAGKSSLINAIFNKEVEETGDVKPQKPSKNWLSYEADGLTLDILDTQGLQEPASTNHSPENIILEQARDKCPDIAIFLCKAKQVNSGIDEVLDKTEKLLKKIKDIHERDLKLIGVVTQCDELAPPNIMKLPTDNERKNKNINDAVNALRTNISQRDYLSKILVDVIPTAAYAEYPVDAPGNNDCRWNIDKLKNKLFDEVPNAAKMFMQPNRSELYKLQKQVARDFLYIHTWFTGFAAGVNPLPNALIVPLIQMNAIRDVIDIAGDDFSWQKVSEFLNDLGVKNAVSAGVTFATINDMPSQFLRDSLTQYLGDMVVQTLPEYLLPGLGSIISAWGAKQATQKLGDAAIAHFIERKPIQDVAKEFVLLPIHS